MPEEQPLKAPHDYRLGSRAADSLDINGGLVLVVVGIASLVLGAVLADQPSVAPLFVTLGSVLVILGAFYSRIEGRLDAGRGGVKTVVAATRKRAGEANLPPQAQSEAIELAVDRYLESPRGRGGSRSADKVADEVVAETEQSPIFKQETLLSAFEEWLLAQEFILVDRAPQSPDRGYDLAAFGWGEALIAQVRLTPRIASRVLRDFSGISLPDLSPAESPERGPSIQLRRALVVPSGVRFTDAARDYALKARIEIYEIDEEGVVLSTQLPPSR